MIWGRYQIGVVIVSAVMHFVWRDLWDKGTLSDDQVAGCHNIFLPLSILVTFFLAVQFSEGNGRRSNARDTYVALRGNRIFLDTVSSDIISTLDSGARKPISISGLIENKSLFTKFSNVYINFDLLGFLVNVDGNITKLHSFSVLHLESTYFRYAFACLLIVHYCIISPIAVILPGTGMSGWLFYAIVLANLMTLCIYAVVDIGQKHTISHLIRDHDTSILFEH